MKNYITRFTPVEVQNERVFCPDCGIELEATGLVLTSNPPKYAHQCRQCRGEFDLPDTFPRIVYTDKEQE